MKFRKLTDRIKSKILAGDIKKSQLGDEALSYFIKVQSLKKARAAKKKKNPAAKKPPKKRKDGLFIPKGSELERIVKGSALQKGMSTASFIKKHREEIERLAVNGTVYIPREVDSILGDMKSASSIYVNGEKMSKAKAKFLLSEFKREFVTTAKVIPVVNMEYGLTLNGKMILTFPMPDEYEDLQSTEDWFGFLDSEYPEIFYIPES